MRHLFSAVLFGAASVLPASAQLAGDGYYRVENAITDRYAYLTDNKGEVITTATTVDVRALELWKGFDKASCDPATIFYLDNVSGNEWNITAQGTNLHEMIGYYMKIRSAGGDTYYAYGTNGSMAKYLGDANKHLNEDEGVMSADITDEYRKWWIKPVGTSDSDYLGLKPTVTSGGKYYHPYYVGFPFTTYSSGMKVYYIKKIGYGMAVMEEITGTVPAAAGVFVECASPLPVNNKLSLTDKNPSKLTDNLLNGVYFNRYTSPTSKHNNRTPYDSKTMRVLGTDNNGNLAFVTGKEEYLRANQSYLVVPEGSPETLRVVTQSEYNDYVAKLPTSVTLSLSEVSLRVNDEIALTAEILPTDCVDTSLTWTSGNPEVATVTATGRIRAIKEGTTDVTVTTVNGLTATCKVTVSSKYPSSISISPETAEIYEDEIVTFTVTLSPADAPEKSVKWSSSSTSVAIVDGDGKVTAVKAGSAVITATTANSLSASATVTVLPVYPTSVSLDRTRLSIPQFGSAQLSYTITPDNVKDKTITWKSEDESIVTVSETGVVTAIAMGKATVKAVAGNGVSGNCVVTVTAPEPQSVELEVTEAVMEVAERRYFQANVLPEDAYDTNVTWTSSNNDVATVNILGQVRAVATGECDITATTVNGLSASLHLTVVEKGTVVTGITVSPVTVLIKEEESYQLVATVTPTGATDKTVTWTSDNVSVATVDENGLVKGISEGRAIVTASCQGFTAECQVSVYKGEISVQLPTGIVIDTEEAILGKGETLQLTATVLPEDATDKSVVWVSSDPAVARVSQEGLVTALRGGVATISANTVNSLSAACHVTVDVPVQKIILDRDKVTAVEGTEFTLIATVLPEDATDKKLDWRSDNPNVATVNDEGDVKMITPGDAVITVRATDGSGVEATCQIMSVSGIEEILGEGGVVDVYTVDGLLLHRNADAVVLSRLPKGIYVIGTQKVIIK